VELEGLGQLKNPITMRWGPQNLNFKWGNTLIYKSLNVSSTVSSIYLIWYTHFARQQLRLCSVDSRIIVNNELDRICKEVVMAYFKVPSWRG
jgi:hypothetical protein